VASGVKADGIELRDEWCKRVAVDVFSAVRLQKGTRCESWFAQ
jgi:hypothetical protein